MQYEIGYTTFEGSSGVDRVIMEDLPNWLNRRPGTHITYIDKISTVDDLAVQVAQVHLVVVDDADRAHPRGGQIQRGWSAEAPRTNEQHTSGLETSLPLFPDFGKDQMTVIALLLVEGEQRGRWVGD